MHFKNFDFKNYEEINQLKKLFLDYFFEIDGTEFDVEAYIDNLKHSLYKYSTLSLMIAIEDNVLIGFLFGNTKYYYNNENCGFILELYTSKNFRSKGIARKLVDNFAEMCVNKRIYLTSASESIKFFEKVGFIDTGLVDEGNSLKIFMKRI